MEIRAYAKLNFVLDVKRRKENGYHELEMVMVPISMYDTLSFKAVGNKIVLTSNHPFMPTDRRNIVYKAIELIQQNYNIPEGIAVYIHKTIPSQAGLAGGSSDAAATLKGLNQLFNLNISLDELASLGALLGADVPFCIYEKPAIVKGIGEQIEFIESTLKSYVLLVKPKKGISTRTAFEALDLNQIEHYQIEVVKQAMIDNDLDTLQKHLGNSIEQTAFKLVPQIKAVKEALVRLGHPYPLMTGSGSTVFCLSNDKKTLEATKQVFRRKGYFAFICELRNKG